MYSRSVVRSWAAAITLLLLSGCGGGGGGGRAPPPPGAAGVKEIALRANDLAYDGASGRIFASAPSSAGTGRGNTITVINPATAMLGGSVFVGSEPNKLALSDNGQYLYVALDGTAAVRRVSVADLSVGDPFVLGEYDRYGPTLVEDMLVLPGQTESVAVSRQSISVSPRHAGVVIFDNGVPRPTATQVHTGSNRIEASPTVAGRLYGYNNENTEFGFRRLVVDASGVRETDVSENLISGFGVDIVQDGGRIFATSGRVIDPEARTLLGTFDLGTSSRAVRVRPDMARNRVFFLTGAPGSDTTVRVRAFDATTFVEVAFLEIPNVGETPGDASVTRSFIRWGQTGLAFNTSDGRVILISRAPGL